MRFHLAGPRLQKIPHMRHRDSSANNTFIQDHKSGAFIRKGAQYRSVVARMIGTFENNSTSDTWEMTGKLFYYLISPS